MNHVTRYKQSLLTICILSVTLDSSSKYASDQQLTHHQCCIDKETHWNSSRFMCTGWQHQLSGYGHWDFALVLQRLHIWVVMRSRIFLLVFGGGGQNVCFLMSLWHVANLSISISIVWQGECIATGTYMDGEIDFPTFPLLMLCQIFHSFLLLADRWESRLVMGVANHSGNLL
jgi:hypothetical protein